ncbi:hypothetical protein B0H13DRAFT_1885372 [Mycena leptocephala]|nr:hypothetical protein B0H13DRAFT_1885372 [Mycena leptocephala]
MNLLANAEDTFFGVANTLILAQKPAVPISNMSRKPRFIRKGEILGKLVDPEKYFDTPGTNEELEEMKCKTALISAVIKANLDGSEKNDEGNQRRPDKPVETTTPSLPVPTLQCALASPGVHVTTPHFPFHARCML